MKRTPEQEATRRAKQVATAVQTKCPCGNCAAFGDNLCGRCRHEQDALSDAVADIDQARKDLREVLDTVLSLPNTDLILEAVDRLIDAKIEGSKHD